MVIRQNDTWISINQIKAPKAGVTSCCANYWHIKKLMFWQLCTHLIKSETNVTEMLKECDYIMISKSAFGCWWVQIFDRLLILYHNSMTYNENYYGSPQLFIQAFMYIALASHYLIILLSGHIHIRSYVMLTHYIIMQIPVSYGSSIRLTSIWAKPHSTWHAIATLIQPDSGSQYVCKYSPAALKLWMMTSEAEL